ncbi:M23 family metallopeptidase [Antarcticirhabdus aurantiaca]|uniref:M23 family metallopeptidase n=1 Tax=Antarcticirhabdus aurantiaca TaxID=2606717 RepID=A0ACD4NS11_9HYPH|nr:M23 family metallopeptidase [Antarcticirhabdus aurantiaca]WAJ29685.1 M23 family metallopeptidase [Jeongeuplla avenae]
MIAEPPVTGNEPPLVADGRRRPDRRQVSARWLLGTLLTGLTSTAMMGVALSAAYDWRDRISSPASPFVTPAAERELPAKGGRVFATAVPMPRSRQRLEIPTLTRDGEQEVVRALPFAYVNMSLAARHQTTKDYPAFDAMRVFSDDDETDIAEGDAEPNGGDADEPAQFYGAKVDANVTLTVEPFDFSRSFADVGAVDAEEAERLVRQTSTMLSDQPVLVAALQTIDPLRFDSMADAASYEPGSAFRVVEENVSLAVPDNSGSQASRYAEEIVPVRERRAILALLAESGHEDETSAEAGALLGELLGDRGELEPGDVLRIGTENREGAPRLVRLSAYRSGRHMRTVAAGDTGGFLPAEAPVVSAGVAEAFDENATEAPMRADMPTVYDGIYQAALSYGMDNRLCGQLIRMLASEVDYQARLDPSDRLVVFFSLEEGKDEATAKSEILYVEAHFGGTTKTLYRFRTDDDASVDYYDADGRSAKQFLLRNPVPNGRFTSPFGSRRHPILGYNRPHWGVDWAAPRGTPILASGAGTVEKAGWTSGYGRQTVIRHANGYETSYSHQNGIAKGVSAGARVRQGQVIGYVGSTGLSTGNHLHYEVSVNGKKVDPMKIRLPSGRMLEGDQLDKFRKERDRIDQLLREQVETPIASAH